MSELLRIKKLIAVKPLVVDWKKYIVSKKLLLIRPNAPGDTYTTQFSHPAAELVKNKAVTENWSVTDLSGNDANKSNVESKLNTINPDFVIQYDHGGTYTLYGQNSNVITPAIDSTNVNLLAKRAVSTVSCLSAAGLGPMAISSTSKAYLGYDDLHWVHLWYLDKFTEAANAGNYALLEGKTFQEAYDIGYAKHTEKWNELVPLDSFAASLMLHDRDHLTLLGSQTARAYRGLLFIRPIKVP